MKTRTIKHWDGEQESIVIVESEPETPEIPYEHNTMPTSLVEMLEQHGIIAKAEDDVSFTLRSLKTGEMWRVWIDIEWGDSWLGWEHVQC